MDVYALFTSVKPSSAQGTWPISLLDEEKVIETHKTILMKLGNRTESTKGGAADSRPLRIVVYELDV